MDGYSPIYTPDTWSESGETYKLGTKGLVAWAGLIAVLLAVGANLIISTSPIGSLTRHARTQGWNGSVCARVARERARAETVRVFFL